MAILVVVLGGVGAGSLLNEPAPTGRVRASDRKDLATYARRIQTDLTKVEDALIVNVHSALVERCMRARGFDVEFGKLSPRDIGLADGYLTRAEVWTFDDLRRARRMGYGIAAARKAGAEVEESTSADIPTRAELGARGWRRYRSELYGRVSERAEIRELDGSTASIPGGGCLGAATSAIWGDIDRYLMFRDARTTADSQLWLGTLEDRAVDAALRRWKSCMKRIGIAVDDPTQANVEAAGGSPEHERRIATGDVACKRQTRLVAAFVPAFFDSGDAVMETLGPILSDYQEFERAALARARSLRSEL